MNYHNLFFHRGDDPIKTALVGAGQFGATFIGQASRIDRLDVDFVCDVDLGTARQVLASTGIDDSDIVFAQSHKEAAAALSRGQKVISNDFHLLNGLKLDCVVEATGSPEAAAQVAETALNSGFHLAMITKEADIVVGPYLHKKAKASGLHVTPAHGDQPSLLIALMSWVETLGMRVLAAGKSSEYDFVFNPKSKVVSWRGHTKPIDDFDRLWRGTGALLPDLAYRAEQLAGFPQRTVPDLCEMGIVCNHSSLRPDNSIFHAPHARTIELCDVFGPLEAGGILSQTGVIDVFNCMRRVDEQSFGGGVFVIVDTENDESWDVLREKGICVSQDGRRGMLYNPSHLLGLEAPISIMSMVALNQPTGSRDISHNVDLQAIAARDWKAGEVLAITDHHRHEVDGLKPTLGAATMSKAGGILPYYMAAGNKLLCDVKKDQFITSDMVKVPVDSCLWRLRAEMEIAI